MQAAALRAAETGIVMLRIQFDYFRMLWHNRM
jgi:hypothetical protein